jgi:hypothetical protein
MAITRVHVPTGAVLEPASLGQPEAGRYVVADDGMIAVFSGCGDVVRLLGE